jgi:hypothetical protein
MKMALIVSLLLAGAISSVALDTNAFHIFDALGDKGREIREYLASYDETGDHRSLSRALGVVTSLHTTNAAGYRAVLIVELEMIDRCLRGRDPLFNPHGARAFVDSTMPPEGGPELKEYEERRARNAELEKEVNRELTFELALRYVTPLVTTKLEAIVNSGDRAALASAVEAINHRIQEGKTRDDLLNVITNYSKKMGARRQK